MTDFVSAEEIKKAKETAYEVADIISARYDHTPKAFVHTYGCQGNLADSERLKGMLKEMGYEMTEDIESADFILYNTCAIREHAEDRVFGNIGAIKRLKKENRSLIIAVCGCMMQQEHVREKIIKSYPFVDIIFGTFSHYMLPELIKRKLTRGKRVVFADERQGEITEGLPVYRDRTAKAWLPIMYGCNNFCTYCVVPYVRGRERSRKPEDILQEAKSIIADGYKDITLLGQNVNSYGKGLDEDINFSKLLRMINNLDGDFTLRFMTSHPRDCTHELIDTIAECEKVSKHIHLPFQSGNDRILKEMNRHYTREQYLSLIDYAKEKIDGLSLTSDVIVGFPGETYEEFKDTLSLIEEVGFTSLFTFIFSARKGTKAAEMDDPVSAEEKGKWFKELINLQESIARDNNKKMLGKTYRVLVEGPSKNLEGFLAGRTDGNVIVEFKGDSSLIGKYCYVRVTETLNWLVHGEYIEK
ncbi:MAG: tRNA (N6-isopentenyl adenosine(37)-C2)-methylthiotransferase MiaB [Clostridiales bacterium]|nr:tRNA (N6-isopentenyl adenosine(37)-C2)-methylthiotransferase MiaB [Clostridiales bacterium]